MNEERKLDEKALEGVTGGTGTSGGYDESFFRNNCAVCVKHFNGCPYNDDPAIIYDALDGGEICYKRSGGGFNRPK